jgi:hypothetical protein
MRFSERLHLCPLLPVYWRRKCNALGCYSVDFSRIATPVGPKSGIDGCTLRQPHFPEARQLSYP